LVLVSINEITTFLLTDIFVNVNHTDRMPSRHYTACNAMVLE